MEFNKVINGIIKYIDREIIPSMNEWQEVVARIAMSRFVNNSNVLKDSLTNNSFVRTFAIIDDNGNVDVNGLANDLKEQIRKKGKIEFTLPIFGTFRFVEADIEKLRLVIMEG